MENNTSNGELRIDHVNGRVWVTIGNMFVGFDKDNFIKIMLESDGFKKAAELHKEANS